MWTIPSQPLAEAHFATFPEELVRRCVLSGCPPRCCPECGTPWATTATRHFVPQGDCSPEADGRDADSLDRSDGRGGYPRGTTHVTPGPPAKACDCTGDGWLPGVVLDPFMGSGTTAVVAHGLGRDFVGVELNPAYVEIAKRRLGLNARLTHYGGDV